MKLKKDFKNDLGIPNEGFHKTRFLSFARNDFFGTIFLGFLFCLLIGLPWYFKFGLSKLDYSEKKKYWLTLLIFSIVVMFIYGIIIHRLFEVNTTLNTKIFGEL